MERKKDEPDFGRFDLNAIANGFPDTAETLLLDSYLTDEEAASVRVFRVYSATPAYYHAGSDEHLYVLSGRGTFWMDDPEKMAENSRLAICCSSSAALSTPCPTLSRVRSRSSRLTRPGAIRKTSSS